MAKNEVSTVVQQTAVALPADMLAMLAQDAKETAALERPQVSSISLRAGIINYAGEAVKGNKLEIVIVAASHLNTYYDKPWDPDVVVPPTCFAISETGKDMVPHENIAEPQNATCTGCPKAEWGSAGGKSRGKACKEVRRLVVMPADALESAEDVAKAELAMLKLPVTSVGAWGTFVNSLAATLNLPHYAVVAEITTQPDPKSQFKVIITPVRKITDPSVLMAVMAKRDEAKNIALVPFDPADSVAETAPATANKF